MFPAFSTSASSGQLSRTAIAPHTAQAALPTCPAFQSPESSADPAALRPLPLRPFAGCACGSLPSSFSWRFLGGILCQLNCVGFEIQTTLACRHARARQVFWLGPVPRVLYIAAAAADAYAKKGAGGVHTIAKRCSR